jgi:hypothetical protein
MLVNGVRRLALFGVANALFFFWQLRHPVFRFTWPVLNDVLGIALGLCLPWLFAIAIFRIGRPWSKAAGIVTVLPLLLYSGVFLLGSAMMAFAFSFDQFAETPWKGSHVRFYRTDGGATTDYGVVIRQERSLFPGLRLVRRIDDLYPCASVDATTTNLGISVTDESSQCEGLHARRREYRLKPFLYF